MSSTRFDETRDYGFADKALALRERAGLTQRALAALLGVSGRAVQAWEAGLSYPGAERLAQMIVLYVERGAFPPGREEDEAAALWEAVRAHAPRRTVPFDRRWFASLRDGTAPAGSAAPHAPVPAASAPRRDDWGEAPDAGTFYGRVAEMATLSRWLLADRCRLIAVLGMGGIGKTLLAARLARAMAPRLAVVYWRSLRNAPPVEEWLAGAIAALSAAQALPPDGFAARLGLLLELLQERRGLLVLDNLETILEPGAPEARYREGYAGYGEVLRRMGESVQQGCLLLTGREAPPELAPLAGQRGPVRTLRLGGLGREAGRALLQDKGLAGDETAWDAVIARYSGNPLALSVVGETIGTVFGGDIRAFLAQDTAVFGGIRQLLDGQVSRLSGLERAIGSRLAVEREPVGFAELAADLGPEVPRGEVLEAVEALLRRSLLERGAGGTFTLQPVVLEHATGRLLARVCEEVLEGKPALLVSQPLLKAQAKDYVRRSQERLIAQPLLERLRGSLGNAATVEERLLALLGIWRGRPAAEQGYGPGNVVNLLRLLRGDLQRLDLSHLAIRHAYLQEVEAQDASLAGAHLSEAVLDEAFNFPTAMALSADGAHLAVGTSMGDVYLWRVADRTLLLAMRGHTGGVLSMALSGDGRRIASGNFDGTVKLWTAESGRLLATLRGHSGPVWGVALSGDGRRMVSGSQDGTVKVWATESGQVLATLQGHTGGVWGVTLSGDGRLVASGSFDGTVKLWETESGRLLATLQGHSGGAWCTALSGDGRLVASSGMDGTVKLWAAKSGQVLATLQGHTSGVRDVALSEDGRLVASSSVDGTVKLWAAESGQLLSTLQGRTDGVQGVALSGHGRLVASGSQDGTVKLWTAESGQLLATLRGHSGLVWGVALSGDGRLIASGSEDGTVKLWAALSGQVLATLRGHTSGVYNVALSADGQLVASGSQDGTVKLWAALSGQVLATLQGHSGAVLGVALSGDGELMASGSVDGTVELWATSSGQVLATLRGHSGAIRDVALSGDGRLVASGSQDGTVRLWAAPTGRLLATLQGHTSGVRGVALSGDGRLVAGGSFDGTVTVWEAESGRLLASLQGHTSGVRGVALSGDGRLVASGSQDGTVRLWAVDTRACLHTLRGDRAYERLDITGLAGVTEAQRAALLALGAVEQEAARMTDAVTPVRAAPPPQTASALMAVPISMPGQPPAAVDR